MFTPCQCSICVTIFFISPSAPPLLFPAASLRPLSGICAVSACSASFGSACVILLQCFTVSHTCLPFAPCLHSGCSRCLFLLSFSFCLILLSTSYIAYPGGTLLQKSFKIRSWVPSPQMPYFFYFFLTINRSHAHNTHDKNKNDTGNIKPPKHSHTHKTHSRNDERQWLSSCCQSRRRRRPQDRRRSWG